MSTVAPVVPGMAGATASLPPPWLGIVAVLFGAVAATLTSRLTSSGLADIRGAIGAGFDEGAWITTAFTVAQMIVGPPTVWLGKVLGVRNVLLTGCLLYGIAELLIPFAPNLGTVLSLQALAGVGSGTFIPLTVGFILTGLPPRLWAYGLAAYAMNIVLGLNVASTLEGWYSEHATWRWIFWQNAVVAVPLFISFWFGIPRSKPDHRSLRRGDHWGIFFGGIALALLFAALDQGDRLDWLSSNLIFGLTVAGLVFFGIFLLHESVVRYPGVHFPLLLRRNFLILAMMVVVIRFLVSSSNVLVPNFLSQVRGLRPLEIGQVLLWIALPQLLVGPIVAWTLGRVDPRVLITLGMSLILVACVLASRLDSSWAEPDFALPLLLQAVGQIAALTALVYFFAKHITPADALGFGVLLQTVRLFGGELGTASLTRFSRKMEQLHSNLLGLHVVTGGPSVLERLDSYASALLPMSNDPTAADAGSVGVLYGAVRTQAFTLASADGFLLAACVAALGLFLTLCLRPAPSPPQAPAPAAPTNNPSAPADAGGGS